MIGDIFGLPLSGVKVFGSTGVRFVFALSAADAFSKGLVGWAWKAVSGFDFPIVVMDVSSAGGLTLNVSGLAGTEMTAGEDFGFGVRYWRSKGLPVD